VNNNSATGCRGAMKKEEPNLMGCKWKSRLRIRRECMLVRWDVYEGLNDVENNGRLPLVREDRKFLFA